MLIPLVLLAAATQPNAAAVPTFTHDIAPILFRRCAGCHHEGEVAPFPLLSYADAKPRARLIAEVTRRGAMPPWRPVWGYGHFEGERRLSVAEISTIGRWSAAGAPEGDPKLMPKAPVFKDAWQLGQPDLIVPLPEPMNVPADGPDVYECFVIPMNLTQNRYIRAMEFRPSNRRVVHHALFFADASHIKREPRYSCFGTIGLLPTLGIGGWSPGNEAIRVPAGAALPLAANSRLVAQIHYHPDGKPEQDRWQAGFYFTNEAPVKRVMDAGLASREIDIPPGETHYVVRQHLTIPIAVDAVGIIPHAHFVCREMNGWAILPDGRKKWLLKIRDWDFNWQDQYRYATPIRLPPDTTIKMEFVYDNSAANPRNPHSPPQRVVWGPGVDDEMAGLHVQVIPVHSEEAPQLGQALWGAVMRSVGGRFYTAPPQ